MVVAASDRAGVVVTGPGMPAAGGVGEDAERVAQALVAGEAERCDLAFAGFDCDRAHSGVRGQGVGSGVAVAAVADLGEQLGRGDDALAFEQREEDVTVGVSTEAVADLRGQLADLGCERLERRDEREHDRASRFDLLVAGAPVGSVGSLRISCAGCLPPE